MTGEKCECGPIGKSYQMGGTQQKEPSYNLMVDRTTPYKAEISGKKEYIEKALKILMQYQTGKM